jgi:hypothetical protein
MPPKATASKAQAVGGRPDSPPESSGPHLPEGKSIKEHPASFALGTRTISKEIELNQYQLRPAGLSAARPALASNSPKNPSQHDASKAQAVGGRPDSPPESSGPHLPEGKSIKEHPASFALGTRTISKEIELNQYQLRRAGLSAARPALASNSPKNPSHHDDENDYDEVVVVDDVVDVVVDDDDNDGSVSSRLEVERPPSPSALSAHPKPKSSHVRSHPMSRSTRATAIHITQLSAATSATTPNQSASDASAETSKCDSTFPNLPMDEWEDRLTATFFGKYVLIVVRILLFACIVAYAVTVSIEAANSYANPNTDVSGDLITRKFPVVMVCPSAQVFSPIFELVEYSKFPYMNTPVPDRISAFDDNGNRAGIQMFFNARKLYNNMVQADASDACRWSHSLDYGTASNPFYHPFCYMDIEPEYPDMYTACPKPFTFNVTKRATRFNFSSDACFQNSNPKLCMQQNIEYFSKSIQVTCALFEDISWGKPANLTRYPVPASKLSTARVSTFEVKKELGSCVSEKRGKAMRFLDAGNPAYEPFVALSSWDVSKIEVSLAVLPTSRNDGLDHGSFFYNGDNSQTYKVSSEKSVIPVALSYRPGLVTPDATMIPSENPLKPFIRDSKISAQDYFNVVMSPSQSAQYSAVPLQSQADGSLNRFSIPIKTSLYRGVFPVNPPNVPKPNPDYMDWSIEYAVKAFPTDDSCVRINNPGFIGTHSDYCNFYWYLHSRPFVLRMFFESNSTVISKQYIKADIGQSVGLIAGFTGTLFGFLPDILKVIFYIKDKCMSCMKK